MTPYETVSHEPDDADIRYDLAGNPLPRQPKLSVTPPGVHLAPPPASPAAYVPPPGSALLSSPAPSAGGGALQGLRLYLGLGAGLLLLAGLIFLVQALKPKQITAPTAYATYTAIDNSFSCDQPSGWTMHETGATNGNLATATFEEGRARVRVVSDATGSLIADTMGAGNANLPPAQQIPPVEKLHTMDEKQLAADMTGYKESRAQNLQSAVGDARVSEWTATGGLGTGSLHGYRVTLLGREREFTVICFCPERSWGVLMPAFQRIISSIKPGSGS